MYLEEIRQLFFCQKKTCFRLAFDCVLPIKTISCFSGLQAQFSGGVKTAEFQEKKLFTRRAGWGEDREWTTGFFRLRFGKWKGYTEGETIQA